MSGDAPKVSASEKEFLNNEMSDSDVDIRKRQNLHTVGRTIIHRSENGIDRFTLNEFQNWIDLKTTKKTNRAYLQHWEDTGLLHIDKSGDESANGEYVYHIMPPESRENQTDDVNEPQAAPSILERLREVEDSVMLRINNGLISVRNGASDLSQAYQGKWKSHEQFTNKDDRCIPDSRLSKRANWGASAGLFSLLLTLVLAKFAVLPLIFLYCAALIIYVGFAIWTIANSFRSLQFISAQYIWPYLGRKDGY